MFSKLVATLALATSLIVAPQVAFASDALSTTQCLNVAVTNEVNVPSSIGNVRITIEATNAIMKLASPIGLTSIAGWATPDTKGSAAIGFEGSTEVALAALQNLKARAVSTGNTTFNVVVIPAGVSFSSETGHYYKALSGTFANWDEARVVASTQTYNNLTGYLATVTSASETNVLAKLGVGGWLGGSDSEADGVWKWMTGPEAGQAFSYTNWASGEPNNFFPEGETHLEMKANSALWNDARFAEALGFAIVEFGGLPGQTPTMNPITFSENRTASEGSGEIVDPQACDPSLPPMDISLLSTGTSAAPYEFLLEDVPSVENAFDPEQADLWAEFTSPTNDVLRIPVYWAIPYENSAPSGAGQWRVKFKPTIVGNWSVDIEGSIQGKDVGDVTPLSFTVSEITKPALKVNGRGFVQDSKPFIPVGYNIAWSRSNSLVDYERWFKKSAQHGANWARIWMASWGFGFEWNDTGLGDYTKRMDRAAKLDAVFDLATKYGIYIDLVFLNHGAFSLTTNSEWKDNPYNLANGGPLSNPSEFVTNPEALKLWHQRMRYVTARYAGEPNLGAWEWWNEVDFTPIAASELQTWMSNSRTLLETFDPYNHLITNSWATGGSLRDWSSLDFASIHVYNDADPLVTLTNLQEAMFNATEIPVVVAEMGAAATGEDISLDPKGLHLHNSQWAALFTGFGAPAMYWWWDEYLDPQNLWGITKGLSRLIKDFDVASMEKMKFKTMKKTQGYALVDANGTLAWIRHVDHHRAALIRRKTDELRNALKQNRKPRKVNDPIAKAGVVSIPVQSDGKYLVQVINPISGNVLQSSSKVSKSRKVQVKLKKFRGDIALRLVRMP